MIAGVVLVALGLKKTLLHVDAPLDTVPAVALCGGAALYLIGHVLFRLRNIGTVNRQRLFAAVILLALIPFADSADALAAVLAVAVVHVALIAYETTSLPRVARARSPRGRGVAVAPDHLAVGFARADPGLLRPPLRPRPGGAPGGDERRRRRRDRRGRFRLGPRATAGDDRRPRRDHGADGARPGQQRDRGRAARGHRELGVGGRPARRGHRARRGCVLRPRRRRPRDAVGLELRPPTRPPRPSGSPPVPMGRCSWSTRRQRAMSTRPAPAITSAAPRSSRRSRRAPRASPCAVTFTRAGDNARSSARPRS